MSVFSPSFPANYSWITNQRNPETASKGAEAVSQAKVPWYPICPYVRFAQYDVVPPSRLEASKEFIPERVIFDYELLFVKSGHAIIKIEDKVYHAQPNDVFLFKPKQRHSIELTGNETFIQPHIHFDLAAEENSPDVFISFRPLEEMTDYEKSLFRTDITECFISPFPNLIRPQNTFLIEQQIFEIIQKYEGRQPFSQILLQSLFMKLWYCLLLEIQGSTKKKQPNKDRLIDEIKLYLEQTTDRAVTMDQLSSHFHINKYYISRLFHQAYRVSPIQYHTRQRIQRAMKLLYLTNMSVTEIAAAVGYNSLQSFSKVFKAVVGESPNSFRLLHDGESLENRLNHIGIQGNSE